MKDIHKQAFIEEATELLSELESTLLDIENNPEDKELIAQIFRALHTIKGSSGMFGYDDISMFTHDIETVYDFIRNGKLNITKSIIDLTLEARDLISVMLREESSGKKADESKIKEILTSFRKIAADLNANSEVKTEKKVLPEKKNSKASAVPEQIYFISFTPAPDILLFGTNPLLLLQELNDLGELILLGKFNQIPSIENINPEKCYLSWEMLLKSDKDIDAVKDVFIFVEDQCELIVEEVDKDGKLKRGEDYKDFGKLLSDVAKTKHPDIKNLLVEYESSASAGNYYRKLPEENKNKKEQTEHIRESDTVSSLRVSAEKLDELVNLVGELVIIQARLSQSVFNSQDQEMISISEEVERITWSLRDSALNIRMLPIGTTFSKFKRLVRDLSKELGKEVELTTDGAETELDKTVIEKLNDPLVHIIRNSIDHGIETPALREQRGKSKTGSVHLSASQSGGNVLIHIKDDGAGLNKNAIKEKAVLLGLVNENDELTDSEIYSMIFAAGFSTAKNITSVSGRGVGMDVVKRAIESLRGTIEVSSEPEKGTTITLKLPLTLAIIDGLLVKIEDDHYILPLATVEECIELTKEDVANAHGRQLVNIRGGIVPYINLRNKFRIKNERPDIEQIVIVQANGNRVGFVVDTVLGQQQTVLKSLGKFYKNINGVSGATILGNGTVALILDLQKIIEGEEIEEKALVN